jgi:hypothetical protein
MDIPVIAGMHCSKKQSVTETASDVGVEEALAARHQRKGLNAVTQIGG